ncbi:uncharacterized protein LOC131328558 [Rhododendron vialii]|uniref:uncharacterized protein LOC131328558 n=1 Tax=Rhododendron vialii TaxID=182163 RepID=UPI00265EC515|nr:uncharacterized protein LOC131328558 [Rhododendron vialii]
MAAIIEDKSDPLDFVDECFHISTFAKIYNFNIKPIPDQTMWVHTEFDPIGPPPLRKKSGRPKKNRRKGHDEPKKPNGGVRKYYTTLKCSICKQPGHNARTCSQKANSTTVDQDCQMAMETAIVGGHEIEVAEETIANSGRGSGRGGKGRGGKTGRGGRGGKSGGGGKIGRGGGAMVVGGTGRGGDPASKYDTIAPRGRGRGRGGTTAPPLLGIVIRETNPNTRVDIGTNKGVNRGKGKQPIVCRGKAPITRFGGAPRVGLPAPQGWRRSTRMGNAIFWTQPETSSAASCGSGGGSGSTTMPSTQPSSSTPSTQKSAT